MKKYLMIDDERCLKKHAAYLRENRVDVKLPWAIVRSYSEFVDWIEVNGVPDFVTFDHDIASFVGDREYTGTDCARWLVNHCMTNGLPVPEYNVHSSNGEGGKNIKSIFETYKKYFKS